MFKKLSYLFFIFLTLSSIVISVADGKELPATIKKCGRQEPELQECIRNATEVVIRKWDIIAPELNLPTMNPVKVDFLQTKGKEKPDFLISAKYRNIEISGFDKFKTNELTGSMEEGFHTKNFLPIYYFKTDYEIEGKILFLQFKGSGVGNFTLRNVKIDASIFFEKYPCNNNEECIKIKKAKISFDPEKIFVNLGKPKEINQELADLLKSVLNENAFALWEEFEPDFRKSLTQVVIKHINQLLMDIPINDFFLN